MNYEERPFETNYPTIFGIFIAISIVNKYYMNTIEQEIIEPETQHKNQTSKFGLLALSILFDAVGMLSFAIPGIGEFSDIIWAPISAFLVYKMYRGAVGKIGGMVSFIEEIIPGLDFIPTFTLTWIYQYVIKKDNV